MRTFKCQDVQHTMGWGGLDGYGESRWTLNRWVLSLLRKLVSDSAIMTSGGSSFHHCGPKTEKSCDFADGKKHLFELLPSETRPRWALKWYTRNFVCDWYALKIKQCHITIPTKLTIPPRTWDIYSSKYTLLCPWQSTVLHTVGHTVILWVIQL